LGKIRLGSVNHVFVWRQSATFIGSLGNRPGNNAFQNAALKTRFIPERFQALLAKPKLSRASALVHAYTGFLERVCVYRQRRSIQS
jgi:hypothetical protein